MPNPPPHGARRSERGPTLAAAVGGGQEPRMPLTNPSSPANDTPRETGWVTRSTRSLRPRGEGGRDMNRKRHRVRRFESTLTATTLGAVLLAAPAGAAPA